MNYRSLIFLSGLMTILSLSPVPVGAQDEPLKVTEMAVTTRIVRGGPVDSVRRISSASTKSLYCYTLVSSPDDTEREISHIWYRNGEPAGSYTLPVRGVRWRTYSKKFIYEGMNGLWRVEARDSEGNLLKALEFQIN
jgi:hypothetical protein